MSSDFPPVPPGQPVPQSQPPVPAPARGTSAGVILLIVFGVVGLMFLACAGIGIIVALLLPAIQSAREAARRSQDVNNLKQIGLALQTYHDTYKSFPPAYVADETGQPMHSWRVLLLPFFEDPTAQAIYEQYDFDEPWNGPHNSALGDIAPGLYRCPSSDAPPSETNCVAVVGDETMWPGSRPATIRDIRDGISHTIAIVESTGSGINWMEPEDLTLEEASQGINTDAARLGIRSNHPGGANTLFADGSVHFLGDDTSPDVIRSLLTADGGEPDQVPY